MGTQRRCICGHKLIWEDGQYRHPTPSGVIFINKDSMGIICFYPGCKCLKPAIKVRVYIKQSPRLGFRA